MAARDEGTRDPQIGNSGGTRCPKELETAAYATLHDLARRFMHGERSDHTMGATELVHEAWMRLVRSHGWSGEDRRRFLGFAGRTMRNILVDHARARLTERRSEDRRVSLAVEPASEEGPRAIDALDRALERLEVRDPRLGRIVELRFYAGLSVEEVGEALGVSGRTIKRDWRLARAWLRRELAGGSDDA